LATCFCPSPKCSYHNQKFSGVARKPTQCFGCDSMLEFVDEPGDLQETATPGSATVLQVRLSGAERAELERAAKADHLPLSTYMRRAALLYAAK
jgi:hypothetical protein